MSSVGETYVLLSSLGGNASDLEPRVRAVVRGEERGYGEKRAWVWEKSVTQWEVGLVRCEKRKMCVCVRVCDASLIAARAQDAHATRQMLAALSAGACAGALAHIEANGLALWWCGWERWMRAVGRSGGLAFCSLMHPGAVSASSLLSPWMPMV